MGHPINYFVAERGDTFDVIRKKVLSDAQTHAYMTSKDDIKRRSDVNQWFNTGLNRIKPVSFCAGVNMNTSETRLL